MLTDIVLSNAKNILDKIKVYEIQIEYNVSQNKLKEAIAIILQVLEMLGISLSREIPHALTKQYENSLTIESLSKLPPMTDDYKLAAMGILMTAGPPTYFADAQLFTSIIFTMVDLCIQYGSSAMAAYGYACYGLILAGQLGEIDAAYQSCLFALRLIEQYNAKELKAEICEIFNGHVRHFKDPLTAGLEPMLEGIQSGLEVGKVQYASYIAAFYSAALFYTGENLESVSKKLNQRLELLNSLKNQVCIDFAKIWRQLVANLVGDSTHKLQLVSDRFHETEVLNTLIAADNQTALSALYLAKTNLLYLYREYAQAIENAAIAERYLGSVMGTINVSEHSFYYMLALLGQYPNATIEEQHEYLQIVELRQQQMEKLANAAPMNFLHKYELVEAEKAKVLGQHDQAIDYYDRAIQNAREHGYFQEEALAAELAAEFYFLRKRERLAKDYLTDAYYGYLRWGAIAKVQDLVERHPQILSREQTLTSKNTLNSRTGFGLAALDLATVIKVSQALSEEIIQSNLLDKLMNSMIENAGARTGVLLLEKESQWVPVIEGFVDKDNAIVLPDKLIEASLIYPVALINYVARTQSTLVLDYATEEKLFIDDTYIQNNRPKSVLCLPIIYQSQLKGILYLENNLAKGAFTQNHVKLLSLLASQAAISLENAELYQELQTYSQKLEINNAQLNQINLSLAAEISDRQRREIEREQAQEALFQEKELAQVTLQSIGDAVITTDSQGLVRYLNPIAQQMTGWSQLEAQGLPLWEVFQIINETTREPVVNPLEKALREGHSTSLANHTILISRNGDEFAIDDSAAPIRASNGEIIGAVMVFHDVSRTRTLSRQLSWQASHDALTGLLNRREFEHHLEQTINDAKAHNQQHALCYLDLDQFKIVNDTCGHIAGDELLRQVTALFQGQVRKTDTLARIGGDEFGLLLNQCSLQQAQRVSNTIRQKVQELRFIWQEKLFTIGISIGLVMIDTQSKSVAHVLSLADAACYAAKNRGRNRVQVYQVDDVELLRHKGEMEWVTRITQALEENRFCLYYQTIIRVLPTQIEEQHYEVLLRLQDETGALVLPMAFIPAAERYNLMHLIDRWVIRTLFAIQGQHYRDSWNDYQSRNQPCNSIYAINLSGASINDDQFMGFLHEQFALHQIPPQMICFEITETVAISNLAKASLFISELRSLGCRFALDDFGSGMSSFTYLKNLPVDYLKIDGSFIRQILDSSIDLAMVEAINNVGHIMGLQTIAEFVENDGILEKIKGLGVDYAQGYSIAKPCSFA
ncbi:EAL domain-containing protein [Nostoc sphaeroides CHAB 2801]|uniref:EAL domain-containing protein n=1 Tax=Nostoc sphaeroides TaxID=446679 RepID=UPI001E3D3CE6|nr:EAL domain-containing protein [Nostoc sphaeroides]MCC5632867.1 EAL domain-containing protein [Nostoc sphaeroides CHAB 2801]